MDLKKHLFVIVVAVAVVAALGLYFVFVPSITQEAEGLKNQCQDKVKKIGELAARAGRPDGLKTQKHLDLAAKYEKEMKAQTAALEELWASRLKLNLRFDKAPADNSFDIWLGVLRKEILDKAGNAGLSLPQDIEQRMFREPATAENSKDITLTRGYRLRHMAIMQEVIDILCNKPLKRQASVWNPKDETAQKSIDLGALALEKITIGSPHLPSDKTQMWLDVDRNAGRKVSAGPSNAAPKFAELPYSISSVDIVFDAPLATVPAYLKLLETSTRWMAVVARADFKRLSQPFPSPVDKRIETAGPAAGVNTWFEAGPVQVLVTLDLYEFDQAREDEFNKMLAAASQPAKTARPAAKKGPVKK